MCFAKSGGLPKLVYTTVQFQYLLAEALAVKSIGSTREHMTGHQLLKEFYTDSITFFFIIVCTCMHV